MTDTQALRDLLVKVEAGTIFAGDFVTDEEAALVYDAFPPNDDDVVGSAEWVGLAHDGSLDAAKVLHEAVLPGCSWGVGDTCAGVYINGEYRSKEVCGNPARAWLICILRAMIAQATP